MTLSIWLWTKSRRTSLVTNTVQDHLSGAWYGIVRHHLQCNYHTSCLTLEQHCPSISLWFTIRFLRWECGVQLSLFSSLCSTITVYDARPFNQSNYHTSLGCGVWDTPRFLFVASPTISFPHSLFGINIVHDGRRVLSFPLHHCYPSTTTHGMESSASWSKLNRMTVQICYIVFRRLALLVHVAAPNLFQWLAVPIFYSGPLRIPTSELMLIHDLSHQPSNGRGQVE